MDDKMSCPHCGTETKFGLSVCTGCQAEVSYSKGSFLKIGIGLILVGVASSSSYPFVGIVIMLAGIASIVYHTKRPMLPTFVRQYKT